MKIMGKNFYMKNQLWVTFFTATPKFLQNETQIINEPVKPHVGQNKI